MGYSQFLNMMPEAILVLMLLIVFVADFCLHKSERKLEIVGRLTMTLLICQTVMLTNEGPSEAFGGMYVASQAAQVMKIILTFGTFIVVVMAQPWLESKTSNLKSQTSNPTGEFHLLVLSTLLGMYIMISSGNFLLFFLGLETASVPMACLVAMDKLKKNSAEGAAKYILTATFSSGVMLYGLSFIYASVGTLYFDDVATAITMEKIIPEASRSLTLEIMGLVFFFSGLGFKLSLVPFHFWTADTYEGAPTPVTGYLSVISKGAAAFALMVILMKAFGPLTAYWEYLLYIVIVLSITVANLFAIRQSELKRFMAFSSISQAGYIMLAVIGASQAGMTALMYYVLVYVVANMAVFTVISAVEQSGLTSHLYESLRRSLPDQSEAGVPYDHRPLLAGWHPAVCWYVLQVLRLHGSRRARLLLGLLRRLRRLDQHCCELVLLPAHRQGHVYQADRQPAARVPHR